MNIKIINQNKDIARVIINEPKTYNSLSYKNLKDLIIVLKKLDKDWNSLNKHTLKEIVSTDAYRFHFNDADWNDENLVDQICKDYCNIDEKN